MEGFTYIQPNGESGGRWVRKPPPPLKETTIAMAERGITIRFEPMSPNQMVEILRWVLFQIDQDDKIWPHYGVIHHRGSSLTRGYGDDHTFEKVEPLCHIEL